MRARPAQVLLLFALLFSLLATPHDATARHGGGNRCRRVQGYLVSQLLTGPECKSPVSMCSRGRLYGDVRESFVFTATSLTPSSDTPTSGVMLYTGDMVVSAARGKLFLKEAGAFDVTRPRGDVGAVSVITGGTDVHEGASGVLHLSGTFTPTGGGHSNYEGEVCD
jgi:hypothetical protein